VIRRALAVAGLALLLTACGSEATMDGESGSADAQVTFTPDPLVPGAVTFTVTVTNDASSRLELEFTSGQRADVQLLDDDGESAYTWSATRMFSQALETVRISSGGNEAFVLDADDFDVAPGTYTLRATVTASNHDLTASREVTVRSS
jgi:hypothetical protein